MTYVHTRARAQGITPGVRSVDYDLLDVRAARWPDDFSAFKNRVRDLEAPRSVAAAPGGCRRERAAQRRSRRPSRGTAGRGEADGRWAVAAFSNHVTDCGVCLCITFLLFSSRSV